MQSPLKSAKFLGVFAFTTLNQCVIDYKKMAYEIIFKSSVSNEETNSTLRSTQLSNCLFITIKDSKSINPNGEAIFLDKKTAIKLAKELRKQISFLED